ncbi:hypothetical protein ZWY2020_001979 [Hordeum vulgare]|nr:hypothetical protein ZWY2020_001979 [Hordeum vulgare]
MRRSTMAGDRARGAGGWASWGDALAMSSSGVVGQAKADAHAATETCAPSEDVPDVEAPLMPEGDRSRAPDTGRGNIEAGIGAVGGGSGALDVRVLEPLLAPTIVSVLTPTRAAAGVSSSVPPSDTMSRVMVPG